MSATKLPQTDSIEELAQFWDTHDVTDFEDKLEEVTEPVFRRVKEPAIQIYLPQPDIDRIDQLAADRGTQCEALIREWVIEKSRVAW